MKNGKRFLAAVLVATLFMTQPGADVLAGAVGSFCTAFTLDVSLPLVYAGCALCALIFLAVWSLPRRWWALPLAVCAGLWGAALWRMWDGLALGEVSVRCSVVNTFCLSLELDGMIRPVLELPEEVKTKNSPRGRTPDTR